MRLHPFFRDMRDLMPLFGAMFVMILVIVLSLAVGVLKLRALWALGSGCGP